MCASYRLAGPASKSVALRHQLGGKLEQRPRYPILRIERLELTEVCHVWTLARTLNWTVSEAYTFMTHIQFPGYLLRSWTFHWTSLMRPSNRVAEDARAGATIVYYVTGLHVCLSSPRKRGPSDSRCTPLDSRLRGNDGALGHPCHEVW